MRELFFYSKTKLYLCVNKLNLTHTMSIKFTLKKQYPKQKETLIWDGLTFSKNNSPKLIEISEYTNLIKSSPKLFFNTEIQTVSKSFNHNYSF